LKKPGSGTAVSEAEQGSIGTMRGGEAQLVKRKKPKKSAWENTELGGNAAGDFS